jgi:hypothetical protein
VCVCVCVCVCVRVCACLCDWVLQLGIRDFEAAKRLVNDSSLLRDIEHE